MMLNMKPILLFGFLFSLVAGCTALFDSKNDPITDEIFDVGRVEDPRIIVDVVGYAALVPFWEGFDAPTGIAVGFDEMIYVTDANGVHIMDRAGRRFKSYPIPGAIAVAQDRNLNVFVAGRFDTVVTARDQNIVWNLACVYVLRNLNNSNDVIVLDKLVHPFMDESRATTSARIARLNKNSPTSDELVQLTGIGVLADNTVYVTRRGPVNNITGLSASDNTVLEYIRLRNPDNTFRQKWRNAQQITALNPTVPSLISGLGMSAISTFIAPPQRERFSADRGFLIAQADQNNIIPFRVLWVSAVESPDGLSYVPNTSLLAQDTSRARRFLYETNRFTSPSGIAVTGDGTNYIFVTDSAKDSLYVFQNNGYEGVRAPGTRPDAKPVIASFGGRGTGPREFNNPSGVAYFRRVVYVADKGNNRIARYKLNTDFE
jgi:hypothetical protein